MPYVTMKDVLAKAKKEKYAVGAFDIFDQLSMKAVVEAASETRSPVIIQVLPPVVDYFGAGTIAGWARQLADDYARVPMVLHLDHGRKIEMVYQCIDAKWGSVMMDASDRPLDENISVTKKVVDKAHSAGITVEGEIGCIFSVDEKKEVREKEDNLASVPSCSRYFQETGIDALAPAIGTAHGLYKDVPRIDYSRLEEIGRAVNLPMVIHGGTGLTDQDFRTLVKSGAAKINIWTQICIEFCDAVRAFAKTDPPSNDPIAFTRIAAERIRKRTTEFIRVFGSEGKA
jgi:fructose-bisphosphate aldolase class II